MVSQRRNIMDQCNVNYRCNIVLRDIYYVCLLSFSHFSIASLLAKSEKKKHRNFDYRSLFLLMFVPCQDHVNCFKLDAEQRS